MKSSIFVLLTFLSVVSCKKSTKESKSTLKETIANYVIFGKEFYIDTTISSDKMVTKLYNLNIQDTIDVQFSSTIKDLCAKKGCWMKLPLTDSTETMVRFKDYGFFMPLDAKGKEVIVNGKAFVQETSVEQLQHYAADAGKTKEEIAQITAPKKEFAFIADGVLLKAD